MVGRRRHPAQVRPRGQGSGLGDQGRGGGLGASASTASGAGRASGRAGATSGRAASRCRTRVQPRGRARLPVPAAAASGRAWLPERAQEPASGPGRARHPGTGRPQEQVRHGQPERPAPAAQGRPRRSVPPPPTGNPWLFGLTRIGIGTRGVRDRRGGTAPAASADNDAQITRWTPKRHETPRRFLHGWPLRAAGLTWNRSRELRHVRRGVDHPPLVPPVIRVARKRRPLRDEMRDAGRALWS